MQWLAYPSWLSPGDNAWQMTAATLVGLMSVPGLVVLYGGVIYFCPRFRLFSAEGRAYVMVHELAHFTGPETQPIALPAPYNPGIGRPLTCRIWPWVLMRGPPFVPIAPG